MRSESHSLLEVDGSHGEGGGALLRTCLVMSALTQQPVRIKNIRGGTKWPGIDIEDLTLLNVLEGMSKADTVGAHLGSETLTFLPSTRPTGFKGEIGAAKSESGRGSNVQVILGSLLPALARSGVYSSLIAKGETYGSHSVSYDYFANVTLFALRKAGLHAFPELLVAGFGRESAGVVALDVEPSALTGIEWSDRGSLRSVNAVVSTCGMPESIGERIVSHLELLARNSGLEMEAEHVEVSGKSPGAFVTTWATYERGIGGGTAMGARGLRGETLGQIAFNELLDWMSSSATIDPFLADQLLLPLVLAETPSAFTVPRLTKRFLTTVWVIKQFTPIHITVRGTENAPGAVRIERR